MIPGTGIYETEFKESEHCEALQVYHSETKTHRWSWILHACLVPCALL